MMSKYQQGDMNQLCATTKNTKKNLRARHVDAEHRGREQGGRRRRDERSAARHGGDADVVDGYVIEPTVRIVQLRRCLSPQLAIDAQSGVEGLNAAGS